MLNANEQIRKERIRELYEEHFHRHDTVVGTIIGCNSYGCYVRDIASNEVVFYYGNGMKGDKVQLTVKKVDVEKERVTCMLDSVLEYGGMVA